MLLTDLSSNISYGGGGDAVHAMEASISGARGFGVFVDRTRGCEDMFVSLTMI
jgi:hypothetical protein